MSALHSALKKTTKKNKTQKHVFINPTFNEIAQDSPVPITPRNKSERWTTKYDEEKNRKEIKAEKIRREKFPSARKNAPFIAARIAQGRFKTNSSPSSTDEDVIQIKRSNTPVLLHTRKELSKRMNSGETKKKGFIPGIVSSVFGFFRGKKGGKKTRKNRN